MQEETYVDLSVADIVIVGGGWTDQVLRDKVAAVLAKAAADPAVIEKRAALNAAQANLAKLESRHGAVNARAVALSKSLIQSSANLRDALVQSDNVGDSVLTAHGDAMNLAKGVSDALQTIVSDLIPAANLENIRAQSEHDYQLAEAILVEMNAIGEQAHSAAANVASLLGSVDVNVGKSALISYLRFELTALIHNAAAGRRTVASQGAQKGK